MLSIAERHKYILDSLNRRGFVLRMSPTNWV